MTRVDRNPSPKETAMTTTRKLLSVAAVLGAISAAGVAAAHDGRGGPGGGPLGFGRGGVDFVAIDANGDGALGRDELVARSTSRIVEIDLDRDGAIERAELIEAAPTRGPRLFDVFAPDPAEEMADRVLAMHGGTATGSVAVADLAEAQVNMLLTRLDENRDDALSQAEAEAAGEGRRGEGRGHGHMPRP
jgi:hypothetical protein